MSSLCSLVLVLVTFLIPYALSSDLVPVLMWDSYRDARVKLSSTPVLSKVNQKEFRGILSQKLRNNPIVIVFAEENLSIEDLSWQDEFGQGAFQNLQNLSKFEDVDLFYLPFVDSPLLVLEHIFPQNSGWNEAILEPEGIPILSEDTPYSNFLRVKLEDAKPSDGRSDLLKRHDATIFNIYQRLKQNHDHVIAIYTSFHSSWHVEKDLKSRKTRQVSSSSEKELQGKKGRSEESFEEQDELEDQKEFGSFSKATSELPSPAPTSSSLPPAVTTSTPPPEWPTFMTIPILSGLMVTSILLIILGIAISAMMDIKPMLRFDDPKGKALTFAVQE